MGLQTKKKVRVGDLLIEQGLITQEQLITALQQQKETGKRIGQTLINLEFISEQDLLQSLANYFGYPLVDLGIFKLDPELIKRLPEIQARRYKALVLSEEQNGLLVAMLDPTDLMAVDDIARQLGTTVYPAFIREADLFDGLDTGYRKADAVASIAGELEGELEASGFDIADIAVDSSSSEAPVVRLLQNLFEDAVSVKASDIHIEPEENLLRIRLRVDGDLQEQVVNEKRVASAVVSRLKILSGLDISEKRLPQDGRFKVRVKNRSIDVRLSTMPVPFGETVVMRLLDQTGGMMSMKDLGMPDDLRQRFQQQISKPHGIVLVTGPTGSGKTTTLYSALNLLNKPEKKIITAEDPIEYSLPRINQVQINSKVGLNFATVLRSALRQDPDIVLIGEMRDQETSEIALRAAMTGHLVLSTLHTNDAVSTAMRLLDMDIDGFMLASAIRAVMAQRLIKRLCENCKQKHTLTEQETAWLKTITSDIEGDYYKSRGCHRCNNTGYQGRIGVYELLEFDQNLLSALRRADYDDFTRAAKNNPTYRPLSLCALDYTKQGISSLNEVLRIDATLERRR